MRSKATAVQSESFWPALIAIIFGAFMAILSNTLINVAIPSLMADFNTDLSTVQWVLTGFMLAMGTVIPVTGYLGDKYSYKRVYLVSLIGFTIFSALCATSWNVSALIGFRILQGLFGGMVMPLSMTIVYQIVPLEKRGLALGVWGIAAMAGPAIGPTLSGWIIENASWRWLFIINVPVGILAIWIGAILLPFYKLAVPKKLDRVGLVTAVTSSVAYLLAFSEGHTWGWTSPKIIALLFVATLSLVLFIWWELRTDEPLLELHVFKKFRFTVSVITGTLITIGLYSGVFLTPIFLQNIQQTKPIDVGLILLPSALAMALMMPISGRLFDRFGGRFLVPLGIIFLALGTWKMGDLTIETPHSYIMFWMAIRNIGIGLAMMPATTSGMNVIPIQLSGRASSISNWIRQVMGSFSIALFTSMLATRQAFHSAHLTNQVSMFSPTVQSWWHQATTYGNAQLAMVGMYGRIQLQGFTLGVNDVYHFAAVVIAVAFPIGFLLGGAVKRNAAAAPGPQPQGKQVEAEPVRP